MTNTIWCLFSVANMYDQPGNNLEYWWLIKPFSVELAKALSKCTGAEIDPYSFDVQSLVAGKSIDIGNAEYRLESVAEGEVL